MIEKVFYDGKPKDDETKLKVKQHLNKLDEDEKMYIIGIDYSTEGYGDYTGIARYTNEDGTMVFEGMELL